MEGPAISAGEQQAAIDAQPQTDVNPSSTDDLRVNIVETGLSGHELPYVTRLIEGWLQLAPHASIHLVTGAGAKIASRLPARLQLDSTTYAQLPANRPGRTWCIARLLSERHSVTVFPSMDRFLGTLVLLSPVARNVAIIGYVHRHRRALRFLERHPAIAALLRRSRNHLLCPDEFLVEHVNASVGYDLLESYQDPLYGLPSVDLPVDLPSLPTPYGLVVLNDLESTELLFGFCRQSGSLPISIVVTGKQAEPLRSQLTSDPSRIRFLDERLDDRSFIRAIADARFLIVPNAKRFGCSSIAVKARYLGTPVVCFSDSWVGRSPIFEGARFTYDDQEAFQTAVTRASEGHHRVRRDPSLAEVSLKLLRASRAPPASTK